MCSKFTSAVKVMLALAMLAIVGCQPSTSTPSKVLQQVDPQLIVQRGSLFFVADSQTGRNLAQEHGMPCLLFFTAEWCTFCHKMEEASFYNSTVQRLANQFVCVLVDADREPNTCSEFQVRGYPTVQFLAADGRQLHSLVGQQSTSQLLAGMQIALERVAWLDNAQTQQR